MRNDLRVGSGAAFDACSSGEPKQASASPLPATTASNNSGIGVAGITTATTNTPLVLGSPPYQAASASAKQEALFAAVAAHPYAQLPELGTLGVGAGKSAGEKLRNFLQLFRFANLRRTFDQQGDVRPARDKPFHPFGTVAKVAFEPVDGSPYTGLFASGAQGIARLSLAVDDAAYNPGIALKLFVDGAPSRNVLAINSLEPQAGRDFFARPLSNVLPKPRSWAVRIVAWLTSFVASPLVRPVTHLAEVDARGRAAITPKAPYQVIFQPAGVHFPRDAKLDFRDQLAKVPAGVVLYDVLARATPEALPSKIGVVRLQSAFVASSFGDRELHFHHPR